MAVREEGDFVFGANLELKKKGTIDARQLVDDFSNLLEFTSSDYIAFGFPVFVKGKTTANERGWYSCRNDQDLSNPDSWVKEHIEFDPTGLIRDSEDSSTPIYNLAYLTQAEFEALDENDDNTIYFIKRDNSHHINQSGTLTVHKRTGNISDDIENGDVVKGIVQDELGEDVLLLIAVYVSGPTNLLSSYDVFDSYKL